MYLTHGNIIFDILENIAHVGSFKHFVFVYLRICVIVYLCILHLIHGNVIFDILESHAFQKYSTFTFTFTLESEEFEKFEKVALLLRWISIRP